MPAEVRPAPGAVRAPGILCLVVGPSGAGKDTLIDAARSALEGGAGWHFPRRCITRPADAGGEAHHEVSPARFRDLVDEGAFALHWQAHDLHYGVPAEIDAHLAAGTHVLVNVSRGVIDQARARYARLRVFAIQVPLEELARRLASRGRESEADIRARLGRAGYAQPTGDDVVSFENLGDPQDAGRRFVAALETGTAAPGSLDQG